MKKLTILVITLSTCFAVPVFADTILHNDAEDMQVVRFSCGNHTKVDYFIDRHTSIDIDSAYFDQNDACFVQAIIPGMETPEYRTVDNEEIFLKHDGLFSQIAG